MSGDIFLCNPVSSVAKARTSRLCDNHGPRSAQFSKEAFDESEISAVIPSLTSGVFARSIAARTGKPFVVEYYYKAKWGYADEFLQLFKKNHYPLLKKEVDLGRILKVWMDQPRYHTTEDGRWDYRVTIVFKNSTVANEPFDEDALKKQLWPDQATYAREEQRRFEILLGHWDLLIRNVDLDEETRTERGETG